MTWLIWLGLINTGLMCILSGTHFVQGYNLMGLIFLFVGGSQSFMAYSVRQMITTRKILHEIDELREEIHKLKQ